jgi:hypothetical protein
MSGRCSLAVPVPASAVLSDDLAGAVATVGVPLSGDEIVMRSLDDRTWSACLAVRRFIVFVRLAWTRPLLISSECRAGPGRSLAWARGPAQSNAFGGHRVLLVRPLRELFETSMHSACRCRQSGLSATRGHEACDLVRRVENIEPRNSITLERTQP